MKWEKKRTKGIGIRNSYYHECTHRNLTLTLIPSHNKNTWSVKLTFEGKVIHKDKIIFRSINDAKEAAYGIMKAYLQEQINYWENLQARLREMKE